MSLTDIPVFIRTDAAIARNLATPVLCVGRMTKTPYSRIWRLTAWCADSADRIVKRRDTALSLAAARRRVARMVEAMTGRPAVFHKDLHKYEMELLTNAS